MGIDPAGDSVVSLDLHPSGRPSTISARSAVSRWTWPVGGP